MRDSSNDESSSDDSSSITSVSNNEPMTDTTREPPKVGGVIVKTFSFVCVMCLTFCELTSIVYPNLLEAVLGKFTIYNLMNSSAREIIWLGDDWHRAVD